MNIKEQIFDGAGFSDEVCLNPSELSFLQQMVSAQWAGRIKELYPDMSDCFLCTGLPNYHLHANKVDHNKLWHKRFRLLPKNAVNVIKTFDFFMRLRSEFGSFSISNVVLDNKIQKEEEIYWRLVRPGVASDIGPLHADKWFHNAVNGEHGYGMFPPEALTLKIWIAIYTKPNQNGLLVVPHSHKKDWKYSMVEIKGHLKPCIGENFDLPSPFLVPAEPGKLIIFNEKLLHGGAINQSNETRVSAEITIVLDAQ